MSEYIRPKHTYTTIYYGYEVIDNVAHLIGRRVVKDTDTAKDHTFNSDSDVGSRAAYRGDLDLSEPKFDNGMPTGEKPPEVHYPEWPEWNIPAEDYPPPVVVWVDYPPELGPEEVTGETGEEGKTSEEEITRATTAEEDPNGPGYTIEP